MRLTKVAVIAVVALGTSIGTSEAAPIKLTDDQMEQVTAGGLLDDLLGLLTNLGRGFPGLGLGLGRPPAQPQGPAVVPIPAELFFALLDARTNGGGSFASGGREQVTRTDGPSGPTFFVDVVAANRIVGKN